MDSIKTEDTPGCATEKPIETLQAEIRSVPIRSETPHRKDRALVHIAYAFAVLWLKMHIRRQKFIFNLFEGFNYVKHHRYSESYK